jgi:hypothetical protein
MDQEKDVFLSVPEWADFMDAHQYAAFLAVLDDEMQRRGWSYELDGAAVVVEGEPPPRFGLVDLAKKCLQAQEDPERWPGVVADHFNSLARSGAEMEQLEQMTFDEVRDLLRVRLYPPGLSATVGRDSLVLREVAPCLDEVLVVDLPSVVVTVKPEIVAGWGREPDELLALARDNIREEDVGHERVELDGGVVIDLFEGESHFVASRVLVLDLDQELEAPLGALVGIPNRHTMAMHVIRDLGIQAEATRVMLGWLDQAHREGPGSVSPHLFWLTPESELLQFDTEDAADGSVSVIPPRRFIEEVLLPLSRRLESPGN